jgi:hypothetical protein
MKTKIETLKEVSFVLGLVLIGIVIGISYYIAYEAYSSIKSPISWNTREELAIYSAKAEEEQLKTDILVEVEGGGNSGQDESPLSIEDKIRKVAEKYEIDWKILKAICIKESNCDSSRTGDGGKSWGAYQIYSVAHPNITEEQARDFDWSTEWTAQRLNAHKHLGEYEMIRSHNGLVTWNNYYVDDVYKIMKTL